MYTDFSDFPEIQDSTWSDTKFNMDVKLNDGTIAQQHYNFSKVDKDIIRVGDFSIEKNKEGKWSLVFPADKKELQDVKSAIAMPNEIRTYDNEVRISLRKVKIADNGNIEFELETTQDRRTGKTRNFTLTPNSIKTSKGAIPIAPKGEVVGVTLPRNFQELFLGNNSSSTISSTLPAEFFVGMAISSQIDGLEPEPENAKTRLAALTMKNELNLLKVDNNIYTIVGSKMMKVQSIFHIERENGEVGIGFTFKKGAETIARVANIANRQYSQDYIQEQLLTFAGIDATDWNDPNKYLYDNATLSAKKLTAKEFETPHRSRAKSVSIDGYEIKQEDETEKTLENESLEEISEPTTQNDLAHEPDNLHAEAQSLDENKDDIAQGIVVNESEQENVDDDQSKSSETTETTSEHASDETAADAEHSEPATDPEQTEPAADPEQTEQDPASTESPADGEQKADGNSNDKPEKKQKDKKDKKEGYEFSLTPLFYGIGLTLSILAILTGMVWLLALGALFFATPKMTEGIVNDKQTATYQESERMKKFKKSLEKTKDKIKDNLKLQTNLIKSKDKDLKLAHKLLRQKTRKVKMTKEWTDATKDMFEDGKVSASTKELLDKLEYPAKSSQFKNHSEKLKQFDEFLTSVQNEIENPEGRFNNKQKEELAPLIKTTLENLKTAQDLNSELSQASDLGSALKNEANFSTLTQQKMTAGLQGLGLDTKDIVDEEGKSTFGEEIIAKLNQQFDDKFQTYKEYLDKDGILEENIANVYETMDKFQTKTTNTTPSRQP